MSEIYDDGVIGDGESESTWADVPPAYDDDPVGYEEHEVEWLDEEPDEEQFDPDEFYDPYLEQLESQAAFDQGREIADAQARWQREQNAYEQEHGRPLSDAEKLYLTDAANYLHLEDMNLVQLLEERRASMTPAERMQAALEAQQLINHEEDRAPHPSEVENFGNLNPMERAEIRTRHAVQQMRIRNGELHPVDEEY